MASSPGRPADVTAEGYAGVARRRLTRSHERKLQNRDRMRPLRVRLGDSARAPPDTFGAIMQVSGGCGIRTHEEAHAP